MAVGTGAGVSLGPPGGGSLSGDVNLSADVTGNLQVASLNSGIAASAGAFWAGDGTWQPATGTGTVTGVTVVISGIQSPSFGLRASGTVTSSGGIEIRLADDLNALETLVGSGYPVRTNQDTWSLGRPLLSAITSGQSYIGVSATSLGRLVFEADLINLQTHVTGNLSANAFASGAAASATSFLAGDGTWRVPSGGGTVTNVSANISGAGLRASGGITTAGSLEFRLGDDVAAVEAVTGSGYAVRTNQDTWSLGRPLLSAVVSGQTYLAASSTTTGQLELKANLVNLNSMVTGNLSIVHFASGGAASATSFLAGDGTWRVPAGTGASGGTVTSIDASGGIEPVGGTAITGAGSLRSTVSVVALGVSAFTVSAGNRGQMLLFTAAGGPVVQLSAAEAGTGVSAGWYTKIVYAGTGTLTVSGPIDGAGFLTFGPGQGAEVAYRNASAYSTNRGFAGTTLLSGLNGDFLTYSTTASAWTNTSGNQARTLLGINKPQIDLYLAPPAVQTYILSFDVPYAGSINSLIHAISGGTNVTARVMISGAPVSGLDAVPVTATRTTTSATGANTFVTGQRLDLRIVAVAGSVNEFFATLKIQRTG